MKMLEEKILRCGTVIDNSILKIDSFLNYQISVSTLKEICSYLVNQFKDRKIDKVLTIETSGIAYGVGAAMELGNIDVVFAKKVPSSLTVNDDNYCAKVFSFTRQRENLIFVRKSFIKPNENILIVDDFLAAGSAALGLVNICKQAKANVIGVAAAVEKEFQGGRRALENLGLKVVSAARITAFKNNKPVFYKEEC